MKKPLAWLLVFLLAFSMAAATAETATVVIPLAPGPLGVALLDESGRSLSTVLSTTADGGSVYWTLSVENSGWQTAWLYTRDMYGNWLNTNVSFDAASFFPASGTASGGTLAAGGGGAAPRSDGRTAPWPVYDAMNTYSVTIKPLDGEDRAQSRCGPSRNYHGAGGYLPYKVIATNALFIEGSYMLVDLQYLTVEPRRVYFKTSAFSGTSNVPAVELTAYAARTIAEVTPVFGPGGDYDVFTEAAISAGVALQVFFEEDGWVFAEFSCDLGPVRAWLPLSAISW